MEKLCSGKSILDISRFAAFSQKIFLAPLPNNTKTTLAGNISMKHFHAALNFFILLHNQSNFP